MHFAQDKNQIYCMREADGETVCSFDAQLDRMPPHVEGNLTPTERAALDAWMCEREALRNMQSEQILFDSLPALLDEAATALAADHPIDQAALLRLKFSLRRLLGMLRLQKPADAPRQESPVQMSQEEYLSQQLRELSEAISA